MSATKAQLDHLAAWVIRRRKDELDWTQLEVAANGGPSNATLTKIENGVDEPSRATLKKLDKGLWWQPGSAKRVLEEMGEPTRQERDKRSALRNAITRSGEVDDETKRRLLAVLDGEETREGRWGT